MQKDDAESLAQRLTDDTGIIGWEDLERHFARGVLVVLSRDLDIVAVGMAMARDDKPLVEAWSAAGKLRRASLEDAQRWHQRSERFRALVVAPWVLAQPTEAAAG